jgi:hypothetical protein
MKTKFSIPLWPNGEDIPGPDDLSQISDVSFYRDYANEGDEYLDDSIRTVDQDFGQIDGTYDVWKMRSARALNK